MKHDKYSIGVLRKMYMYGYIGASHTSIDNLQKSFGSHEQGKVKKKVEKLVRAGYIVKKGTGYGMQCSLNKNLIPEIEKLIEDKKD